MRRVWEVTLSFVQALGLIGIAILIWIGLPILGIDDVGQRAGAIALAYGIIGLGAWITWRARRSAAAQIEETLLEAEGDEADILAERMKDAVTHLKRESGAAALYDLPWYVLIGPPGAGKTTALVHSGLDFPGAAPSAATGFGGTRNCDVWFAREAVLIDTAGRYTTQDSDAARDGAAWTAFLEELKRARPDQPINGVLLTLSCADLMGQGATALARHAEILRARLDELTAALKIDLPVYAVFTKADRIAGFRAFFEAADAGQRRGVWGHTFQTRSRAAPRAGAVDAAMGDLITRLADEVPDRMVAQADSATRISLMGFPRQMALLRPRVAQVLSGVFGGAEGRAVLRGFYFTSGTQEGTPFDQVLGALTTTRAGLQSAFLSGRGKSYFLHDLLARVIFAERDWAGTDRARMLRRSIARTVVISGVALSCLAAAGAFGWTFWQNASLVRGAQLQADRYAAVAAPLLAPGVVESAATRPLLPALAAARAVPGGYGAPVQASALPTFGLSRVEGIRAGATLAYSDALERLLRPRMMILAERRLAEALAAGDDPTAYRALRVVLQVAKAGPADDLAVQAFFAEAWAAEYAGEADVYRAINAHLGAMLALDDRVNPAVAPDAELVAVARSALADMPLGPRVMVVLEGQGAVLPPLVLGQAVPGLRARDGQAAEALQVPGLYTSAGSDAMRWDGLTEIAAREAWVLGQTPEAAALRDLPGAVEAAYADALRRAWAGALGQVSEETPAQVLPALAELVRAEGQGALPLWDEFDAGALAQRLAAVKADPAAWTAGLAAGLPDLPARMVRAAGGAAAEAAWARDVLPLCRARIAPFAPFAAAGAPVPLGDFRGFYGAGGILDGFTTRFDGVPLRAEAAGFFDQVAQMRDGVLARDVAVQLVLDGASSGVRVVEVDAGQGPEVLGPGGLRLDWPLDVAGLALRVNPDGADGVRAEVRGGPWALPALVQAGTAQVAKGPDLRFALTLGPHRLALRLSAVDSSAPAPFQSAFWGRPACPEVIR
ncbi:MAG: type VI secretion system membrane subunit TssM [Pseudomonadota bacterium]